MRRRARHFADEKFVVAHAKVVHFFAQKVGQRATYKRRLAGALDHVDTGKAIRTAAGELPSDRFLVSREHTDCERWCLYKAAMQARVDAQAPLD